MRAWKLRAQSQAGAHSLLLRPHDRARTKMGSGIILQSLLFLWMLTSLKASSALARAQEPFSMVGDDLHRATESTAKVKASSDNHKLPLPAGNMREKRNLLGVPPGFTWINGALYPTHDIFYRSDASNDAPRILKKQDDSGKFDSRFGAGPQRDVATLGSPLASFGEPNPAVSLGDVENLNIQSNLQPIEKNEKTAVSYLPEKEPSEVTERPVNLHYRVPYFLTSLVPPNADNFAVRYGFSDTERSRQEYLPSKESNFQVKGNLEKNFIPDRDEASVAPKIDARKYVHGSANLQSITSTSETTPELTAVVQENILSIAQVQALPEEPHTEGAVNTGDQILAPNSAFFPKIREPSKYNPLNNVDLGVRDSFRVKTSDEIQGKSVAKEILPNRELSSLTSPSSSVEYIPVETQHSVPSVGSSLSIEPSYTHTPNSVTETFQPTPPLPLRIKPSSIHIVQLNTDKTNTSIVNEHSLSNAKTTKPTVAALVNPVITTGLMSKSAVAHLLKLKVNRFEERERSHPSLFNLTPVAPPEYNRVSLLNRLKQISHSRKLVHGVNVNGTNLPSRVNIDNILGYVGEQLGSSRDVLAKSSDCNCTPRTTYKTLVVIDDEVIGTYGLTGFRRRNYDFGTAWKNFPTTTIAWPASVKELLSAAGPLCGRTTPSVSTVTRYHTEVRPQDVVLTHTRTRTLFTVLTRTVTRFRGA